MKAYIKETVSNTEKVVKTRFEGVEGRFVVIEKQMSRMENKILEAIERMTMMENKILAGIERIMTIEQKILAAVKRDDNGGYIYQKKKYSLVLQLYKYTRLYTSPP